MDDDYGWGYGKPSGGEYITGSGGDWISTGLNLIGNLIGGGGGGSAALLPCPQDDEFSRKWYPVFLQKARSTNYPASSWWFGNIVIVFPDGRCARGPALGTLQLARAWWSEYAAKVGPIWNHEADGSFRLNSRGATGYTGGSTGVPLTTSTGNQLPGQIVIPPPGSTTVQSSIMNYLPWIIGGVALFLFSGGKRR